MSAGRIFFKFYECTGYWRKTIQDKGELNISEKDYGDLKMKGVKRGKYE